MNEDIKTMLQNCLNGGSCDGCPYIDDPDCNVSLINASLNTITQMEATISYLMDMNSKLAEELKNSLDLKGTEHEHPN